MNPTPRMLFLLVICSAIGCRKPQTESVAEKNTAQPASVVAQNNARAISAAERIQPPARTTPNDDPTTSSDQASGYRMLSWNVESEGADSSVIAKQLKQLNSVDPYDVVALTEVLPGDFSRFQDALGGLYQHVSSKSGNNDRLQILYNEKRFELVRTFDLNEVNILNRYRAPLVVHLKDRSRETEFLVMVNHLARGKAEIREQQATMLVEWARDQTLPVVALGDYNFDYVFSTRKGNPGFVNMMRDNIWHWVEPSTMIDTNWYDNPREPDGKDDYPGSMLDFAFVAGPAKDWSATCNVIVREGDFPDDKTTSDHRPFELLITN